MILLIAYVTYAVHATHIGLKMIFIFYNFCRSIFPGKKNPGKLLQGTPANVNVKINVSLKQRIEIATVT
jgi:hypothetical protein